MSSSNTAATSSRGIGVTGLLGVAFIILKLTHTIGWSWWWVTAPLWIPYAVVGAILLVVALIVGVAKALTN